MTISVQILKPLVHVPNGHVSFEAHDRSAAHVDMTIAVQGQPPMTFRFNHGGPGMAQQQLVLSPGSYHCSVFVAAFSYGLQSRNFDCDLAINGGPEAIAKGMLPAVPGHDWGVGDFTIAVP